MAGPTTAFGDWVSEGEYATFTFTGLATGVSLVFEQCGGSSADLCGVSVINALGKLRVSDRTEATTAAIQRGIIHLQE